MTGADELRALLRANHVTHVPGIYDPVTTALAVQAGHRVAYLSSAAVSALMLGRPDVDFVPATQIADRATTLVPALNGVPLIADADTGYGNPLDAVWTGHAYVRAGVSGLHLADQVAPRRRGPEIIDAGLAAAKIKALATEVPELALIAGTGAYAVSGLPEVIARCRAFARAGVDAVFPEGVDDPNELAELHAAIPDVPIVLDRSEAAGNGPVATDAELAAVGVRMVLHPVAALLAALRAASQVYRQIAETGNAEPVDRMPWAAFTALAGRSAAQDPDARNRPPGQQADYTGPSEEIGYVPPSQPTGYTSGGNFHGYTPPGPSGGQSPPGHFHTEVRPGANPGFIPPRQNGGDQPDDRYAFGRLQT